MIRRAYEAGRRAALEKFALAPPMIVDAFMGAVESGKDVAPRSTQPMPEMPPMGAPPALDGTTPLSTQPMPMTPPPMGA